MKAEDIEAKRDFEVLAKDFLKQLRWGGSGEKCTVELFVYDGEKLGLRPVLGYTLGLGTSDWRNFLIPLGDGIAGAAFQQRSILPWAADSSGSMFTKPIPNPFADIEMRAILAVPVFHPAEQNKARPSPWGTIGVVSFGSSSTATKVPQLLNRPLAKEDEEMLTDLRGIAQAHVHKIIQILTNGSRVDKAGGGP